MFNIVNLIYFVVWPVAILFALFFAVKQKRKEAIIPLSTAAFCLISVSTLAAYEEITRTGLGEVNFAIMLVTFIISFIFTIVGLVALVKD
jgi:hypothetical protein